MASSWMYITASLRLTLYTGVTTNLESRIWDHKTKRHPGFTATYNCDRLVYFEEFGHVLDAIAREKQVKGWRRAKKLELIRRMNPEMKDLAADLYPQRDIDEALAENRARRTGEP